MSTQPARPSLTYNEAMSILNPDDRHRATLHAMNSLLIERGIYTQGNFADKVVEWTSGRYKAPGVGVGGFIAGKVMDYYEIDGADLRRKTKGRLIVLPRQVCMYLLRALTEWSLPEIGNYLGGKHHTTILHGIRRVAEIRQVDRDLDRFIARVSDEFADKFHAHTG